MKVVANHPTEDVFGLEIWPGDTYFIFGKDVVHAMNVTRYLIEQEQVECYRAED